VVHACNPNPREAEAGESRIGGQAELHREILSQENQTNRQKGARTLEKCVIPILEQEMYNISLKLVTPESKEVI
jgi:hypothetical protein